MVSRMKTHILIKSIWNGILGISTEILAAVFLIITGALICLLWQGLLFR